MRRSEEKQLVSDNPAAPRESEGVFYTYRLASFAVRLRHAFVFANNGVADRGFVAGIDRLKRSVLDQIPRRTVKVVAPASINHVRD